MWSCRYIFWVVSEKIVSFLYICARRDNFLKFFWKVTIDDNFSISHFDFSFPDQVTYRFKIFYAYASIYQTIIWKIEILFGTNVRRDNWFLNFLKNDNCWKLTYWTYILTFHFETRWRVDLKFTASMWVPIQ